MGLGRGLANVHDRTTVSDDGGDGGVVTVKILGCLKVCWVQVLGSVREEVKAYTTRYGGQSSSSWACNRLTYRSSEARHRRKVPSAS
jgi:hypothetical protein